MPHEELAKKVRDLDKEMASLPQFTQDLLNLIHRPGWTTQHELDLVTVQVDAIRQQVNSVSDHYARLIAVADKIGR